MAEPGFLGMQVQGMDVDTAEALGLKRPDGVMVRDVAIGAPAATAGIHRGDRMISFAGSRVRKFGDLLAAVGKTEAGQKIEIVVIRRGRTVKLTMKTTHRPAAWRVKSPSFSNLNDLGFTISAMTPKVRKQFQLRWGVTGLVVTLVNQEKRASNVLKAGDIIVQVNLRDVWRPTQLVRAVEDARKAGRNKIILLVENSGGFSYI